MKRVCTIPLGPMPIHAPVSASLHVYILFFPCNCIVIINISMHDIISLGYYVYTEKESKNHIGMIQFTKYSAGYAE